MKRFSLMIACLVIALPLFAQNDVTKFLGIPIDGYKHEMIQKLKEKGFVESPYAQDVLTGEFNGKEVSIHIATNNNKVYRIVVADKNVISERDIQIRFNNLCHQFSNNPKYLSFDDYTISDDEDISYEMAVNEKRYEANFYQKPEMQDTVAIRRELFSRLLSKYTEEQLNNPSEEIQAELKEDIYDASMDYVLEKSSMKSVWFMICEYSGEYYISIFYDNEYNKANGDDL